jgi:hypothetical protein
VRRRWCAKRVQIVGLVPLRHDVGARLLAGLHDRPSVRAVVRIDVDDSIAVGLRENSLDVGDALLAVALRHQRHIVGADRLREGRAALVPGRVIGIGERANGVDDRRIAHSARRVRIAGTTPTTPAAATPLRKRRRGIETREPNGSCGSTIFFSSRRPIDAAKSVAWMSRSTAPRLSENPASASASAK